MGLSHLPSKLALLMVAVAPFRCCRWEHVVAVVVTVVSTYLNVILSFFLFPMQKRAAAMVYGCLVKCLWLNCGG